MIYSYEITFCAETLLPGAWRQNKSAIASVVETLSPVANPKSRLSRLKVDGCLAINQAEAWQSQAPLPD